MHAPHRVVFVTSSYPRFDGDTVGTCMEPIANGLAARGHEIHVVLPWHPLLQRGSANGVHFHPFRYAPVASLNVFGYAAALKADVALRPAAIAVAPFAFLAGWRAARVVAQTVNATVMHAHWLVPGGVIAAQAARELPLVISLHGSDIYVAERHRLVGRAATHALRRADWITACSDDLARRAVALGATSECLEVVPYGVDTMLFKPDPIARRERRAALSLGADDPLIFTAGRLVCKKGFEYAIEACAHLLVRRPRLMLAIAGSGDLDHELRGRAAGLGIAGRVRFLGTLDHPAIAAWLAAADVSIVPSVRDDAGNVDGLPNIVLETLASETPLVATTAGGISAVACHQRTAILVPERDAGALAAAIETLLQAPETRALLGRAARAEMVAARSWDQVAARFEAAYKSAAARQHLSGLPG